jgi:TolB protein
VNNRALALWVGGAMAGIVVGLGGATLAASAGGASPRDQPRTLFAGGRRIYAFALGTDRITWISHTHMRGRFQGCEMYVRTLRIAQTRRAPLPGAGCGMSPPRNFAPQAPVLADGVAAWVKGSSCGNSECFWAIATITGGEAKARVVESADISCDYTCDGSFSPRPALAGAGNLLVYSAGLGGGPDLNIAHVRRIVGRHTAPFAQPPGGGDIESLVVGGGAVEAVSRVLAAGDGCGCLDSPAWSPDGSKIAYLHGRFYNQLVDPYQPSAALAVMNADGSARHDLSTISRASQGPVWSPDGKQLAYGETSSMLPYPEAIAIANADGSGAHEIGLGDNPTWSPDGSKIAFADTSTNAAIFTMNPDGSSVEKLASFAGGNLNSNGMAWSPDGTRIAFSLDGTLEVMNTDGSNTHPLGNGTPGDEPSWSPDSSQIVFHTATGLSMIGADGSGLHKLTNGPDGNPSWSPDGQTIVFGSDRNDPYANARELYDYTFPELYLVAANGSNIRPLSFTKSAAFEEQGTFYRANRKRLPPLPGVPTLAGNVAAVGNTKPSGAHEITLYSASSGRRLASVRVGRGGHFSVAGASEPWIVFQVARKISALNLSSKTILRLTTAAANPVDLSVSGRRVAWAENINGHGRIRTLDLPR